MGLIETIIIAIVEGLTEFLPVSSTGHMILVSAAMKIHEDEFVKTFEIAIQLGAILAIVMLYAKRFLQGLEIYYKLFAAFLPAAVIGFFAYEYIKAYLFNPVVVAIALIIGGIVLIAIDRMVVAKDSSTSSLEKITYKNALYIGFFQCLAMVPGTSRAAATIIGGVFNGFDKKQATEFSFLLAVPTMIAATGYDLLQTPVEFSNEELKLLGVGMVVAFISAWVAVKIFLKIVENYGFKHFGYYRILIGGLFLIFMPDLESEQKPEVVSSVETYQNMVETNPAEELVDLKSVLEMAVFDIRYATADNFTGEIIYSTPGAYARRPVTMALIRVQDSLQNRDLTLKIFDTYRPYSASVKLYEVYSNPDFVADPREGSRHNRGCAVDVTLADLNSSKELEMPTAFDDFSEVAASDYQDLPAEVLKNRSLLIGVMDHFGFDVLPTEWWHFDFRGWEKFPLMDLSFEELREL